MVKHDSKDRRTWIRHYLEHGRNIAATCSAFGISRATFYRWFVRYDPAKPSKPLMARSRRPLTKRQRKWTEEDLQILAEINLQDPTFGAGRLTALMKGHGIPYSRATIGRMLSKIRRRCPTCWKAGTHSASLHATRDHFRRLGDRAREEREYRNRTVRGYEAGHRQPGPP